jgi:hypothetical protein
VCNRVESGVYFKAYLAACNQVYLVTCFQVCCMQCDVEYVQHDVQHDV